LWAGRHRLLSHQRTLTALLVHSPELLSPVSLLPPCLHRSPLHPSTSS
jgi:hypothetical protein